MGGLVRTHAIIYDLDAHDTSVAVRCGSVSQSASRKQAS